MKSFKLQFFLLALSLVGIMGGCSEPPRFHHCLQGFYADGVKEEFCNDRSEILITRVIVPETRYLQNHLLDSLTPKSSSNYLGYLFSIILEKPTDLSLEGEIVFYQSLQLLMKPGSNLTFDANELGGLVFELFDNNGNYYSTELSNQSQPSMKVLSSNLFLDEPKETSDVGNRLFVELEATVPIFVSNEGGTIERIIEFEYPVTFFINIDKIP